MLRKVIVFGLPFLLPFILYGIFWLIARRRARRGKTMVPWLWLAVSGLVLSVGTAGIIALTEGAEPGSTYVPSRVENGVIVPGHHVPKDD